MSNIKIKYEVAIRTGGLIKAANQPEIKPKQNRIFSYVYRNKRQLESDSRKI